MNGKVNKHAGFNILIGKQEIPVIGNILPLKKNDNIKIKINKTIEIVVVPNFGKVNSHQDNVGIILEEKKILKILKKQIILLQTIAAHFLSGKRISDDMFWSYRALGRECIQPFLRRSLLLALLPDHKYVDS